MSSVGSSDGGNRTSDNESIRRKYEDFRQRESELVKKHQKEIRRLNEQHYAEVERLKEDHQSQMTDMQRGSHDAISARDHRYQKEIEDVRNVHRKQLQNMAEDNQRKEEALKAAVHDDIDTQKANSDDRYARLTSDYNNNLRAQEENFQKNLEEGREAQQSAIRSNHEKLTRAHQKETESIRADRDQTVRQLQGEYGEYRKAKAREQADHRVLDVQQKARQSDALLRAVANERENRVSSEAELREGFQDGMKVMRERYNQALERQSEAGRMVEDGLKSGVIDRVDTQVRRLESENQDLKEQNVRDHMKMKADMRREVANVRDAYQKNVENYRDQRDEAVRLSKDGNRKDIDQVRGELEDRLVENTRRFQGQRDEQTRIFRTAYDQLKGDYDARSAQGRETSDDRVRHIVDVTEQEKQRLIALNSENHTANQRLKADQMKALRENLEGDKQGAVNRMQDQMRKQELQHAERMNLVVSKYEKQIQGLKDQLVRERKLGEENMKRMTEEMSRIHKMEVEQVENKNREKVRQLGAQHSTEIRQLNRRHEDKLDQVIGEMKKT